MKFSQPHAREPMVISTLGHFDITIDGTSLTSLHSSSVKIWALFKFMLTHKDRAFTPESLTDQLWIGETYNDPRSTLRKQMHRLRQLLHQNESDLNKIIDFTNGYYKWNPLFSYSLDAEIFESTLQKAESLKETNPEEALISFKNALSLYLGDYLLDCSDQHWVFPIRNYYKCLYLSAVAHTIELLIQQKAYSEVTALCEKAIQMDIYEELFHIHYMEALIELDYYKQAISHYEYITGFYYREMGVKPSLALKSLYKRIMKYHSTSESDENILESLDTDFNDENAFFCDPEVFKSIYELEKRRSQRSGNDFCVVLMTVDPLKGSSLTQTALRLNHLKEHLMASLRKGDTFTLWSDHHLLLLLPGIDSERMTLVLNRILKDFPNQETIKIKQIAYSDAPLI